LALWTPSRIARIHAYAGRQNIKKIFTGFENAIMLWP
jgi:hypothetical protein